MSDTVSFPASPDDWGTVTHAVVGGKVVPMSDTMTVRQECEHESYNGHFYGGLWCPGGKEIVLRREECQRLGPHPDGHECSGFVWVEVDGDE